MAATIYVLCALTAALCTYLLLKTYARTRYRLLLWSGLCFAGMTLNNVLLFTDKIILPVTTDLSLLRATAALLSVSILLYGLIWES